MALNCKSLAILSFLCICVGCKSPIGRVLENVDSYIQDRPDSALAVLETMDTAAIVRPCDIAKYSLLHTMALDKNHINTTNLGFLMPAVEYYSKQGNTFDRLRTFFYVCRINRRLGNYQEAIIAGTKAKQLAEESGDLYWRAMTASEVGYTFGWDMLSDEEVRSMLEADMLWKEYGDELHIENSMANLALAYSNKAMFKEADSLYAVLNDRYPSKCRYFVLRAQNEICSPCPDQKQAIDWYEKAIPEGEMDVDNYYEYAYALALDGNIFRAKELLRQLEPYPRNTRSDYYSYKISELEGNYAEAFMNLKSYTFQIDSTVRSQLDQSVFKGMAVQSKLESEIAEMKRKQMSILIWSVSAVSIMAIFLLMLLSQKRKRRLEAENDRLVRLYDESNRMLDNLRIQDELAKEEADSKLKTMEGRLLSLRTSYARMYQSQLKSIGQLLDYNYSNAKHQIEIYKTKYSERVESILNSLRQDQRNQKEFERIINSELDGIMSKLRNDFPSFRENEFRLLSYAIVGFDATTCATLLDWPENRVRVYKTRLTQVIKNTQSENTDLYMAFLSPTKHSERKPVITSPNLLKQS